MQEEIDNDDPQFDMTGRSLLTDSVAEQKFHSYFGIVDTKLDTTRLAIERSLDKKIKNIE